MDLEVVNTVTKTGSPEYRKKLSILAKMRGSGKWMLGKKLSLSTRKKIAAAKKDKLHPAWKGDSVSYNGLHRWLRRKLGTPQICFFCDSTKLQLYDWASTERTATRNLKGYVRLCRPCHSFYDNERRKESSWT